MPQDYTATTTVEQTPAEVFAAVTDVRGWWNENVIGATTAVGDEFVFYDRGIRFCRFRLTEVVADARVVWHVEDAYLAFIDEHDEWTGTDVVFEITPEGSGTRLDVTHRGLTPSSPCYDACSSGWDYYVHESLPSRITTGTGRPIPKA